MLTNEIFDTFFEVLQPRTIQAPLSSLAEGKKHEQLLSMARQQFEHALSEKLLTLSTKKQAACLTQILGLFEERAKQFAPLPAFTWQDFDKLSNSPLEWAREPNESAALKEFRDKCEHQIQTDWESFLVPYRQGNDDAKEASQLARMVTDYTPNDIDGAFEMALAEWESQCIKEELGRQAVGEAQENVRKAFAKIAGTEAAIRWIWSVDRWYDMYRESRGLQPIGGIFQHSCEASHFYRYNNLRTTDAAPKRPDEPAPTKTGVTIHELCLAPFTSKDLIELLQRLEVVNASGKDLTGGSKGKGRGIWGRFTAAYRVLQRRGLLDRTANDAEWAKAFQVAFGVNLGPEVRSHQLTPHGHGHESAPNEFCKAVDNANLWVTEWQQHRAKAIEKDV